MEHHDELQTTVRALFHNVKTAELVEAARPDDSTTGDRLMELGLSSARSRLGA